MGTLAFPGPLGLAASSDPWRLLSMRIQSASAGWLAGVEGRRTVCQSWEAASTQGLELYQV